jgi:hypothetical protein
MALKLQPIYEIERLNNLIKDLIYTPSLIENYKYRLEYKHKLEKATKIIEDVIKDYQDNC